MKKNILLSFFSIMTLAFFSCDQERLEPVMNVADGGGTLTSYLAYSIDSIPGQQTHIYGRIVFWEDNLGQTLVQVSLYNTIQDAVHPALLEEGVAGAGSTVLTELYDISGNTGELSVNKFFVIPDKEYFNGIPGMDMHINIYLGRGDDTIVAAGDLGLNADPVESN